jgi:hypothetical protein
MVVLFLTVMVAMILLRALRKDIAQYNEASYLEGVLWCVCVCVVRCGVVYWCVVWCVMWCGVVCCACVISD